MLDSVLCPHDINAWLYLGTCFFLILLIHSARNFLSSARTMGFSGTSEPIDGLRCGWTSKTPGKVIYIKDFTRPSALS